VEVGKLFEEKIKGQKSLVTVTLKFKVMGYFFYKKRGILYFLKHLDTDTPHPLYGAGVRHSIILDGCIWPIINNTQCNYSFLIISLVVGFFFLYFCNRVCIFGSQSYGLYHRVDLHPLK
jgi:hypothetical protein